MSEIIVCSLSRLHEITRQHDASHVLTVINAGTKVTRPPTISPENHLFIGMSDILMPLDGHILPGEEHAQRVIDFARAWDRQKPMVVHCYAGVSRSTASAMIVLCALRPEIDPMAVAQDIRRLSPTATPNLRLIEAADKLLGKHGTMLNAAASIGRGADCFEGIPFKLKT
jgi:predicted protein tyrosine phosphatase